MRAAQLFIVLFLATAILGLLALFVGISNENDKTFHYGIAFLAVAGVCWLLATWSERG